MSVYESILPSPLNAAPKYLNSFTCFMMLFILLYLYFVFLFQLPWLCLSMLILIVCALHSWSRDIKCSCKLSMESPIKALSSANSSSLMSLSFPWLTSVHTLSKWVIHRSGDRTHHCLTVYVSVKGLDTFFLLFLQSLYKLFQTLMRCSLTPCTAIICHNASLFTWSNTFSWPTKVT